jgi:hypothetical protein
MTTIEDWDDETFARAMVEKKSSGWNFAFCSERLKADMVFKTFAQLRIAEEDGRHYVPDPAWPDSLRQAYDVTMMLYPEGNSPEFRNAFFAIARAPKPDPDVPLPTRVKHPEVFDSLSF